MICEIFTNPTRKFWDSGSTLLWFRAEVVVKMLPLYCTLWIWTHRQKFLATPLPGAPRPRHNLTKCNRYENCQWNEKNSIKIPGSMPACSIAKCWIYVSWLYVLTDVSHAYYVNYTRNSSGDEIANVSFLAPTPSTTFTQCLPEATEFGEITQNKGHYAIQGYHRFSYQSKAHIRLPISA